MSIHVSSECAASSGDPAILRSGGGRFVQLPSDVKRSSAADHRPACSADIRLPVGRPPLPMELLAALAALFHRYTAQKVISFDLFDGIGDHPIACQLDVDGGDRFREVVARTSTGGGVVEPERTANIAATLLLEPGDDLVVQGAYDVHFLMAPAGDAISLSIAYNAALFLPATINQLIESYGVLLAEALGDPSLSIDSLPLLSPQITYALSVLQDGGSADYPALTAQALFSAMAKTQPAALAASFHDLSLTYRELDERSSQLAHQLIACGAGPEVPVAVCLHPCLDVLVSLLAIWKARAVYLPLDPTHPEALIGRMLAEARPRLVLTSTGLAGLTADWPQLCLHRDAHLLADLPKTAPAVEPSLDDAAYLLYTSGTTGIPKGVVATQRNLVQYIRSAAQKYGFSAKDRFISLARYTFSISLWELVSPLCCGGHLRLIERKEVLSPERLARALRDVTVLHAGPSLLNGLFRLPREQCVFPRMRHASSGGDMVTPAVMEKMKQAFPNAELYVIYGCSEISCMGTSFPIERETRQSRTFVGKPFPNVTLRVLDAKRNLVPFGVVGEICFAGDGVVRGYLDRPELNAEKFIELDGRRFYCTGDMGRLHSDGYLEFLGRRDFQIQLHGIRIELAGIETVAQQLGLAAQCAVVARPHDEGGTQMVAFVVKPRNERIATFRRALAKELPDYMLPHQVVVLDAMPLTVNGKLDRNRLMEMPLPEREPAAENRHPMNERERKVAAIFTRTLGLREVGAEEGFFDLGGDSLLGMIALMEIEKELGVALPPSLLFETGTVRALAGHGGATDDAMPMAVPLNSAMENAIPLFMLSGVHIYRHLAARLDGVCPAYGVFTRREIEAFDPDAGVQRVEDLAEDYIRIMRATQPRGPYRILGYSFSGIVAYEVAQRLRRVGEKVEFLTLIDSHLPEWNAGWRHRLTMLGRMRHTPWRKSAAFLLRKLLRKAAEPIVYHDDRELGEWEVQRGIANFNTIAQYRSRIRSFDGDVLLLVSGVRLQHNPLHSRCCGWEPYIERLSVHSIDADHFQMMRDEPHLSRLAGIVTAHLITRGR